MKSVLSFLAALLIAVSALAQSPNKFSYQAVVRDSNNNLVKSKTIGMRISIIQTSMDGKAVFVETHSATTNTNGLVTLEIGAGALSSGNMTSIDWANGPYFIKTETDPLGGTNYTITGTSQLLSVPYAMHAKTAENLTGGIKETDPTTPAHVKAISAQNIANWDTAHTWGNHANAGYLKKVTETDPVFTAWDKSYTDLTNKPDMSVYATKDMNNQNITNLADPVNAQDAVTKAYIAKLIERIESLEINDVLNHGFTDARDGNHYKAVQIGEQIWMAENLKYLPAVAGSASGSQTIPYYYVNEFNGTSVSLAKATTNYIEYGVLYNWPAAMAGVDSSGTIENPVQGVCPTGWHLPSDAEWTELTTFLGGEAIAGGKLKETGTTHWNSPNTAATNSTGFKSLPGSFRSNAGTFWAFGIYGHWWSSTKISADNAILRRISYNTQSVDRYDHPKELGFSVRCIRN